MGLDGVEIFTNSSGSHHELRKLYTRVEMIKEATLKVSKHSAAYVYADLELRSVGGHISLRKSARVRRR
jgi:hypothetical protein